MLIRSTIISMLVIMLMACSSVPASAEAEFDLSAAGNAPTVVLDDFEARSAWVAGKAPSIPNSSATSVKVTTAHATRGRRALQLNFDARDTTRAVFYINRRINLSAVSALAYDVFNEAGAATDVAIALSTSGIFTWQESESQPLKPGANAVTFDLTSAIFKTTTGALIPLSSRASVRHMAIIVYAQKAGSVFVDKLLAVRAAQPTQGALAKGAQISIQPRQASIAQYGLLEFAIQTTAQAKNPFDPAQIAITLTLTSPTGKLIQVPAYFTQDFKPGAREPVWPQTWRARFTPTAEGNWKARADVVAGPLRASSPAAAFTVTPGISRGFARVDSTNPRYLRFDNGEALFPIGLNLGWGHADPLKDYARWFDALQRNGANVTRIWMASWSFGIEWTDSGLGNYRLDRAWLLDQVMQMAEQRGIYVILVLINHGAFNTTVNPEWASNPYNAELGGPCKTPADFATNEDARRLFKQRLRYIGARWAYSPNLLAWEWWNEVDFTPLGDPSVLRPWLREMTEQLRSVDPYHHLTTISFANMSDPRVINLADIDVLQRHEYNQNDPRITMPKAYNEMTGYGASTPVKPILHGEFGASSAGETPSPFDPEGVHLHNGLWASAFNGFASSAMYWWWDSYIETNDYWGQFKGISDLMSREDISQLRVGAAQVNTTTVQASALITADRALLWLRNAQYSLDAAQWAYQQFTINGGSNATPWKHVLQERRAVTATLESMLPGEYRVSWFDAHTGKLLSSTTAHTQDGNLTLSAPPFLRDVAARVVRR